MISNYADFMAEAKRLDPESFAKTEKEANDIKAKDRRIAELEAEREAIMRKWAIESDESLTECVERNIDGWKQRCLRAEDKALRFDLDRAGIEQRERELVELVELRAERKALKSLLAEMIDAAKEE